MKKFTVLLSALLLVVCVANAQSLKPLSFKTGVKAGLNLIPSKVSYDIADGAVKPDFKNSLGYHVGIASRMSIFGILHLQPELLYVQNSYSLSSLPSSVGGVTIPKVSVTNSQLIVPVLVGAKFAMMRFQAGPVFNVWNQSKSSGKGLELGKTENSYPVAGYMLGAGLSVWKVELDLRLNGNLKQPIQNFDTSSLATTKLGKTQLMLSAGLMF